MPKEQLTLGQYIRNERINYMSLRSFAKELGVSASYLSDIELDRRKVSKQMAMRIAIVLGDIRSSDFSKHLHYNRILELADLLTPERKCLIEMWNGPESYSANTTMNIFDALFGELNALKNAQTGGGK
jgi:transcriptional regulator with XRE-family HTH domain